MAPEHEARMRVLYDHESEEPGRRVPSGNPSERVAGQRRRAVADWGVGEDIFDRMPSRRFTRAERRNAHTGTVVISREPEAVRVEMEPWAEPRRFEREPASRREREVETWGEDESWSEPEPRRAESRPEPALAESLRTEPPLAETPLAERGHADSPRAERGLAEPPARLVAASNRPEPPPARTVVVATPDDEPPAMHESPGHEPPARRTVVISGHPGGLPAARPARPPKTAIERVGTRPDRIVAYAVALGFLLVLIAVLTTGQ